ncbi:MAG: YggS family pyridoxal phosphate-dependent enzyme [Deltaproteobacteria bacterium]|nr:YggS family pyridoxal phosphate-dependent enzyme [Candidatus Zymogenaceae bacterium]
MNEDTIRKNLDTVNDAIARAAEKAGRSSDEITLVTVTKTFGVDIVQAAVAAGARDLGENYVQEAREKITTLAETDAPQPRWHFIGGLQKNKAKYAVRLFDLIHSVDGVELAAELNRRAGLEGKKQDVLIQVNISEEEQKSGVSPEGIIALARSVAACENLSVLGLMGMPPFGLDPEVSRPYFVTLRGLSERIEKERIPGVVMEELSMGMSNDYAVAVEEGATMVRVGTAIFGSRYS